MLHQGLRWEDTQLIVLLKHSLFLMKIDFSVIISQIFYGNVIPRQSRFTIKTWYTYISHLRIDNKLNNNSTISNIIGEKKNTIQIGLLK